MNWALAHQNPEDMGTDIAYAQVKPEGVKCQAGCLQQLVTAPSLGSKMPPLQGLILFFQCPDTVSMLSESCPDSLWKSSVSLS